MKKILIPFVIMVIFNLGVYYLTFGKNFGGGYSPHVGILLISGLLLGPYGAIGAVAGNFLCDLVRGYTASIAISSAVVGFGVSYLAYKLTGNFVTDTTNASRTMLFNIHNLCWDDELLNLFKIDKKSNKIMKRKTRR